MASVSCGYNSGCLAPVPGAVGFSEVGTAPRSVPTLGAELLYVKLVGEGFGDFGEKARGLLERFALGALDRANVWIAQVKLVSRAGNGHVKQAALLFFAFGGFERATGRKKPVAEHDYKHDVKLQTLRLMYCGQANLFRITVSGPVFLSLQIRQKRELREEVFRALELGCEIRQLFQFLDSDAVILISFLQVLVITRLEHQADHPVRTLPHRLTLKLRDCDREVGPCLLSFLRHERRTGLQGGSQRRFVRRLRVELQSKLFPQLVRAFSADTGQQLDQSLEGHFIARIYDELQISGDIFEVRLLEKADAACDAEGNISPGQLELQFQRVKVRSVKHGHLIQFHAFIAQFEHTL